MAPPRVGPSTLRDGTLLESDVASVIEARRNETAFQWTGFEHPYLLESYAPRMRDSERIEKLTSAKNEGQPAGFVWTTRSSRRPRSSTAMRR